MASDSNRRKQLEALGEQLPIMGFTVCWQVSKVLIPVDTLRALLDQHGFAHIETSARRQGAAVNRALSEMAASGLVEEVASYESEMVRRRDTDRYAYYVLVAESAQRSADDLSLSHRTALKVRLDKRPGVGEDPLSFSSPDAEAVMRPLIDKYLNAYTSRDITATVLKPVILGDAKGCTLLDQGGMYFVPAVDRAVTEDLIKRLRALVDGIAAATGTQTFLSAFRQIDDQDARRDMSRHAHAALLGEIRAQAKYLREMQDESRTVRQDTVLSHIKAVEEIAGRAGLYQDLLTLRASDVQAELGDLRVALVSMLTGAKESKDPTVAAEVGAILRESGQAPGQEKPAAPQLEPGEDF